MSQPQAEDGDNMGSNSPPGRESREDWRGANLKPKLTPERSSGRERDRSRSPRGGRRSRSPRHYGKDTNTTSNEPHLQRARLFVGNIEPDRVHRRDLIRLFSSHGEVLGVSVHKGYAFVQMDRERTANNAANCEDNKMFMGSRIHVEFSQAAVKAGAKQDRKAIQNSPPPPPPPAALPRDRAIPSDPYFDVEREHEERLARILSMERELAYLRSREHHDSQRRAADILPPERGSGSSGGGGGGNNYRGYSPPIPRDPLPARDMGMSRSDDRRGGYYVDRQPSPPLRSSGSGGNSYRDTISYPSYDRREGATSSQYGANYSRSGSSPTVGYGGGGSGSKSSSSNVPPGWPGADYDKSANAPFANTSPWS